MEFARQPLSMNSTHRVRISLSSGAVLRNQIAALLLMIFVSSSALEFAFAQDQTVSEDTPTASQAALPLFEIGAGLGSIWYPHYPGSDQYRLFVLPFPYGVYRGEIVRSDRKEGTRARFLSGSGYELSLSGSGAFPVSSEENDARKGMPNLGWIGQMGPKLRLEIPVAQPHRLTAGLSLRSVFASESFTSVEHRGTAFEAELVYKSPNLLAPRVDLYAAITSTFGSEGFLNYLYAVPSQFATATRAEYSARAGYLMTDVEAGVEFRSENGRHRAILSVSATSLDGSVVGESPLVKTKLNPTLGLAFISTLYQSESTAPTD